MGRVFFNTRENLDTTTMTSTTAYSMTEADSGKTFMVSGGTQAITLLPAADLVEGWNCRFVTTASPSGAKTIGAGSAIISGSCQDAGNGVGYTGIRIRGVSPQSTNITINGIPFNDPESHGTYWVNLPDFTSSIESLQVQLE